MVLATTGPEDGEEMELVAAYSGVIKLGDQEIECYVLTNEKRVISQRALVKFITGGRESGNLKRYLQAKSLEKYLPAHMLPEQYDNHVIRFRAGGTLTHGVEAMDVVGLCKAYLQARQDGVLATNQEAMAGVSEIFISASAATGIDAVVDEATGYEYFKRANDLQERLAAYIREGYREWSRTISQEFFLQLYKLEGRPVPIPLRKFPKRFGRYVMRYIYDTLDPEIADWLREHNPKPEGQTHHHQKFNEFGYRRLTEHVANVMGIMKASPTMETFKNNLAIAFPNARTQRLARLQKAKADKSKDDKELEQSQLFEVL